MWQYEGLSGQKEEEIPASPPRFGSDNSKWWHVPDGEIEQLIRRLNSSTGSQGSTSRPSAIRNRSASESNLSLQRSVRFNDHDEAPMEHNELPQEDTLDQAVRESDTDPKKKRGSWKVSDDALLEFIKSTKKALANETEDDVTEKLSSERPPPVSRTALGNRGGYASGGYMPRGQHATSNSSGSGSPGRMRQPQQGRRSAANDAKPGAIHIRNSRSKSDLSSRPPWAKCHSLPNLFAQVGSGLDGKGNCVVSQNGKFEETPIFLSDSRDRALERVRVAVCGHPFYMQRA